MSKTGTEHRGWWRQRPNKLGAIGLLFTTLFGSALELESADRPSSVAAVERYSAPQTWNGYDALEKSIEVLLAEPAAPEPPPIAL